MSDLPFIIDIEASGFGTGSYPIEIGIAMPDGESHCFLIRPESDWLHWDAQAEEIHGIRRQILLDRGRPIHEVAMTLNLLLAGETLYTDAWGMDSSWLGRLFYEAGVIQEFSLETIRLLLSEQQAALFHQTRSMIMQSSKLQRHRASADASILQKTYAALLLEAN